MGVVSWAMIVAMLFMADYNNTIRSISSEVSEIKISCPYLLDAVLTTEIAILDYILIQIFKPLALVLQLSLHFHDLSVSILHYARDLFHYIKTHALKPDSLLNMSYSTTDSVLYSRS